MPCLSIKNSNSDPPRYVDKRRADNLQWNIHTHVRCKRRQAIYYKDRSKSNSVFTMHMF